MSCSLYCYVCTFDSQSKFDETLLPITADLSSSMSMNDNNQLATRAVDTALGAGLAAAVLVAAITTALVITVVRGIVVYQKRTGKDAVNNDARVPQGDVFANPTYGIVRVIVPTERTQPSDHYELTMKV